ncbi:MAG: hypothetical protein P4L41_08735 [Flavipsychrobacter sp.]|nr:hypothetical protein [Flavipsychrobacter sp.]
MGKRLTIAGCISALFFVIVLFSYAKLNGPENNAVAINVKVVKNAAPDTKSSKPVLALDTALYKSNLLHLVHGKASSKWPVIAPLPLPGALLPFNRIVAYYGNFYSTGMGILGALPPEEMLTRLQDEAKTWQHTDPQTPVIPAIHYIAVSAQRLPGPYKKYRLRMPFTQIVKALALATKINAIVFLDIQLGHSTIQEELPVLEPYLSMPHVHLGIDPEFAMKGNAIPSSVIGSLDATQINYASEYLAQLVNKYNLPPKILVIHRFTKEMVTNYKQIITRPEVQIVMNMDGFGFPAKKISSYKTAIANEPVQFTGFKIFYKNDLLTPGYKALMLPEEILKLYPSPIYIQYQ